MLGKLPVPGRPTIWIIVGQGPTVLAVGAGGGCLDICTLIYPFCPLSPSLWETARYRLKGPLSPKQPTNQSDAVLYFVELFSLLLVLLLYERVLVLFESHFIKFIVFHLFLHYFLLFMDATFVLTEYDIC